MSARVIVGGQFGSEGKGKVAYYLAAQAREPVYAVRVGGPNSGHTVQGRMFRQLPTPALLPNSKVILPAGSYINVELLSKEMAEVGLSDDRLFVDPNAVVIAPLHEVREQETLQHISSTCSGVGEAIISRVRRIGDMILAKNELRLQPYLKDTKEFLYKYAKSSASVIIEGTQGYGLSILHSPYYPYVTALDTTVAGVLSEVGLSPSLLESVYLCLRTYPIRVGGESGPLPNEIDWNVVSERAGTTDDLSEYTSVTKKLRRVAEFDFELVKQAIRINTPTELVLNHCDYFDYSCHNSDKLTHKAFEELDRIQDGIGVTIRYFGTGPDTLIDIGGSLE